jgi:thymidine kinase
MFAGKTEELIRRVRRASIARRSVQVFTHTIDIRNRVGAVSSHTGLAFPSTSVPSAVDIERAAARETALIAVDEAQFFGSDLVAVATRLALAGHEVIVGGLDVTFAGEPFPPLPELMALAERVDKLTAVCAVCGADAVFHQRVASGAASALSLVAEHVGGLDKYEARCRVHFDGRTL